MSSCTTNTVVAPARPSLIAGLGRMHAAWRQRQALASLDAAALRDIGVTKAEAHSEARRALWDAPHHWSR